MYVSYAKKNWCMRLTLLYQITNNRVSAQRNTIYEATKQRQNTIPHIEIYKARYRLFDMLHTTSCMREGQSTARRA